MKNLRFLLAFAAIALLALGCGKDDDQPPVVVEEEPPPLLLVPDTLLTVHVAGDFLEDASQTGFVFASNADGTVLDYQPIANGGTVVLQTYVANNADFTATLVVDRPTNLEQKGLRLNSYLKTPAGTTWWLEHTSDLDDDGEVFAGIANLRIEGTGPVAPSPLIFASTSPAGNFENNGDDLDIDFYLSSGGPVVPAIVIYRSTLDDQVRYFFDKFMPVAPPTVVQHANLPIIAAPTTFTFDSEDDLNYWVKAVVKRPNGPPVFYSLYYLPEQHQAYIPGAPFDSYRSYAGGTLPNTQHNFQTEIYSKMLEPHFVHPDFDFELSTTAEGYSFSTSSDLSHCFIRFFNGFNSDVIWRMDVPAKYGITFNRPELPDAIKSAYDGLLSQPLKFWHSGGVLITPQQTDAEYHNSRYPVPGMEPYNLPYFRKDEIVHY